MLTEPTVLPAMMVRSVGRHGDGGTVVVGVKPQDAAASALAID
jgi:hypothetical protein